MLSTNPIQKNRNENTERVSYYLQGEHKASIQTNGSKQVVNIYLKTKGTTYFTNLHSNELIIFSIR